MWQLLFSARIPGAPRLALTVCISSISTKRSVAELQGEASGTSSSSFASSTEMPVSLIAVECIQWAGVLAASCRPAAALSSLRAHLSTILFMYFFTSFNGQCCGGASAAPRSSSAAQSAPTSTSVHNLDAFQFVNMVSAVVMCLQLPAAAVQSSLHPHPHLPLQPALTVSGVK
eukprot:scaffold207717_cov19-Tisochrysis_lutea.AAC.1